MHGCDRLQSFLHVLLAQQLAECIEDDAIADAEEDVQWSGDDSIRCDDEEGRLMRVEGMFVSRKAIASRAEEAGIGDDADWTWMLGVGILQSQDDIEEQPVAIEKGVASVVEMLQHGPDVRKGSRVTSKWRETVHTGQTRGERGQ